MPAQAPVLEVEQLFIDIPLAAGMLHAVHGIDLRVERGETLCIVGESGCGKSLTSLAIMDLLPKRARRRAARLALQGTDIRDWPESRMAGLRGSRMGMIFQEPMTSLNPAYTIGNQMVETLRRHRKVSKAEAMEAARSMLDRVGITAAGQRLRQYPHQLSGGLRQRVMIAMTLMCSPELIIADEPTTALDVTIQAQILLLLQELQREYQMGLILITHDLGVVARIATHVAVMYAGQIVEQGTAEQVFSQPTHPYTAGLLNCIPIPGKTQRDQPLGSISGVVPSLIGTFQGCRFADRCPHVQPACRAEEIAFRERGDTNHHYRCIRPEAA